MIFLKLWYLVYLEYFFNNILLFLKVFVIFKIIYLNCYGKEDVIKGKF